MHTCMYLRMYVCMYVCSKHICMHMYPCKHAHIQYNTHPRARMQQTHAHIRKYVQHTFACAHVLTYVRLYVHTCIHVLMYVCMYTHAHIRTYSLAMHSLITYSYVRICTKGNRPWLHALHVFVATPPSAPSSLSSFLPQFLPPSAPSSLSPFLPQPLPPSAPSYLSPFLPLFTRTGPPLFL